MMIKKFLIRAVAISVFSVLALPVQASHSWSIYHWARQANPLPLEVVDSMTSDWQIELEDSVIDWNLSAVLDMAISSGDESSKGRKRCTAISGKMRVCNAAYGNNGWLGLASINLDSNQHITQGTAKMNDSYSSYWAANPDEKYSVTCQEIGHVFGLDHTSEDGSDDNTCMDYSNDTTPDKPNAHDYAQLASIYSHLDSYNSYSEGGSTGGGCNAPPGKGCNKNNGRGTPPMGVRVHGNGRYEIWVAADGKGGYWIHHITLAP